ncbi:sulfotransferase domain-containing protein [Marinobacter sp. F4218]|uniref:sulfotransferase domain-containing protein n=1 Tax=Marinobacter TaxID=2742 RepID=UPI001C62950B|nr:sulfotransferase domain-containing protein [Marinobacter sp. F4218]
MLPNFIIIGTMKGGTSSLYHYIASHSGVTPSSVKETNFFRSTEDFNKGTDWYKSLFRAGQLLAFEASPNYTKRHLFPGVPQRMHSLLPNIKLICILRDPIDRAVSHYVHNVAHGRESRSLSEAINDPQSNYILTSKYYYQIEAFLEYYSGDQILLIESERLKSKTSSVMDEVFRFLDLNPEYNKSVYAKTFHASSKKKRRSRLEQTLSHRTQNPYTLAGIRLITAPFRRSFERPSLSPADRAVLTEALAPDIEKLRRFSGLSFSSWSV